MGETFKSTFTAVLLSSIIAFGKTKGFLDERWLFNYSCTKLDNAEGNKVKAKMYNSSCFIIILK